jgi:hypothetical protein
MTQSANHDPITRARHLAADYQANPTPARAHNAAQVLGAVLDQLDAVAAVARAINDENRRLAAAELVCELFGGRGVEHDQLGKALTQAWIDWHRLSNTRTDRPTLQPVIDALAARRDQTRAETLARLATQLDMPPTAELPTDAANHWTALDPTATSRISANASTYADKPTTEQLADLVAKHMLPVPLCFADGPVLGANTLTCYLPQNHEGDHSTNAHPNPRTWPQHATGGIVDPTTVARIGEN